MIGTVGRNLRRIGYGRDGLVVSGRDSGTGMDTAALLLAGDGGCGCVCGGGPDDVASHIEGSLCRGALGGDVVAIGGDWHVCGGDASGRTVEGEWKYSSGQLWNAFEREAETDFA